MLLTVASFVVFVRNTHVSSSIKLFLWTIQTENHHEKHRVLKKSAKKAAHSARFDLILTIFALLSRVFSIVVTEFAFSKERLIPVVNGAGTALSACQIALRYLIIAEDTPPIMQLGGSLSLPDLVISVLLLFVDTPRFGVIDVRFMFIVRSLLAVLFFVVVFPRLLFAIFTQLVRSNVNHSPKYKKIVATSAVLLMAYTAIALFIVVQIVVKPMAASIQRSVFANKQFELTICLLFLCLAMPPTMGITRKLTVRPKTR